VLPGVVGSIQATEAIKMITGAGESLIGKLLLFDALRMTFRTLRLRKDPACKVCGERPTVTKLIDYEEFCSPGARMEMTVRELAEQRQNVVLIDVREQYEWDMGHLEGARHIPLRQLQKRIDEVPRDREVVVYCAVGGRSAHAVHFLRQSGYERVRNLIGGIKAWAREIDPSVRVY
jgi:adenylyltransferase/sulfurtransferase